MISIVQPNAALIFQEVIVFHNVSIVWKFPGKKKNEMWQDNAIFINQEHIMDLARLQWSFWTSFRTTLEIIGPNTCPRSGTMFSIMQVTPSPQHNVCVDERCLKNKQRGYFGSSVTDWINTNFQTERRFWCRGEKQARNITKQSTEARKPNPGWDRAETQGDQFCHYVTLCVTFSLSPRRTSNHTQNLYKPYMHVSLYISLIVHYYGWISINNLSIQTQTHFYISTFTF